MPEWARRTIVPLTIYAVCALVFGIVTGPRARGPSPNNHYVHLADSLLHGQLTVVGNRPPPDSEFNDWACYDEELRGICLPSAQTHARPSERWYVSFPPVPALVLLPVVAIFGTHFSDPLFWALFAALAPALLYMLLRGMRERKISERTPKEDLLLVGIFAFGSVYFFASVQGSVWFSAQIVCSLLLVLFLHFAIDARRPFWAGLMLILCFATRPTTMPFGLFFLLEAMRVSRPESAVVDPDAGVWRALYQWLRGVRIGPVLRRFAPFMAPAVVGGGMMMWMNYARFHAPFVFGHEFLQIRWRPRIEKWGLFSYHYLSKNIAVFLGSLPWVSRAAPYLTISRHGLAFWVTSPNLLPLFWPKRVDARMIALFVATALVAIWDLCYQNSGWVQFGYRFLLDYLPALIVLLALSRRRFGVGFLLLFVVAVGINVFGAITFDRAGEFYDNDSSQDRVFQPD